jgi:hypothetical protein
MTRKELEVAFHSMLAVLAKVPGITNEMLTFDGTARDLETIGYFYYENVLPSAFPDSAKAVRYVLARALCIELGFDWNEESLLTHPSTGLTVDLDSIRPDQLKGLETDSVAAAECFESMRTAIARRR